MFHDHLDYFQKPPLGDKPNTNPGNHGTLNAHNRWFFLYYHVWRSAWIKIHWNNIGWGPSHIYMTSHNTWESMTTLHDFGGVCGTAFGHFLLGSHNLVVTILGSWPTLLLFVLVRCIKVEAGWLPIESCIHCQDKSLSLLDLCHTCLGFISWSHSKWILNWPWAIRQHIQYNDTY
jgi:hypothetical protein